MSWNRESFPNPMVFGHPTTYPAERFGEGTMLSSSLLDFPGFPLAHHPTMASKYSQSTGLSSEGIFRTRLLPALLTESPAMLDPLSDHTVSSETPSRMCDFLNDHEAEYSPVTFPLIRQGSVPPPITERASSEMFERKRQAQTTSSICSKITISMLLNYDDDGDDDGTGLFGNLPKSKRAKRERRHTISTMPDFSTALSHETYATNSFTNSPEPRKPCFFESTHDSSRTFGESGCHSTGNKPSENPSPKRIITLQTEKIHLCTVAGCDMRFKRLEHLKRHHRIHTMERPFSCSYPGCGKAFSRQDNLRQHTRTHQRKTTRNKRHARQQTL